MQKCFWLLAMLALAACQTVPIDDPYRAAIDSAVCGADAIGLVKTAAEVGA